MGTALRSQFMLDPNVCYLNHGAYGAVPRPVYDRYLEWMRLFEAEPVDFLSRHGEERLAESRHILAEYLGTQRDNIVYVQNGTVGLNIIARNMKLGPNDEMLTTNQEHGGVDRMWRYFASQRGFAYKKVPLPIPVPTHAEFVEQFWSQVNPRVRLIFISHITSLSGLILPVEEICRRAREAGITTIVDGSHAPGQIPLDLDAIGSDFYVGITHKWLCAPRGSAFMFARPEVQHLLEPLVLSWGWEPKQPGPSQFVDRHQWQGSRDISPFLTVPAAIAFQQKNNWDLVRKECHELALEAQQRVSETVGEPPFQSIAGAKEWFAQIACVFLPQHIDPIPFRDKLRYEHGIDVSIDVVYDQPRMRISVQGYNSPDDIDHLVRALAKSL
ncbi:MAG: aminotransferase class V-fold PLP-dependent enzyme [Oscillatoria sp. SIO1A7]|nr:aminotransferase class V-fold PLP-dependent enzyme [Oscillatoria sp. SIO1A7]